MYCEIHAFFINNTFINKVRLKLEKKKKKNQAKTKQHPEAERSQFENY